MRAATLPEHPPSDIDEGGTMDTVITEHPNAVLVRRGYAAFNTADMATLTELFHEDSAWHTPGRSPLAGSYQGRDAVFGHFGQYGGLTAGTFQAELEAVVANDDGTVVGIHRNTGQKDGKTLDVACCIVFDIKDGQLVDGREYFFDLHAWDEFWS
jgi:ketosteroid isomerase-like protein